MKPASKKEDSTDIENDAVREPSSGGFSPVVTDEGKRSENLSTSLQPAKPVSEFCDDHVPYLHFMEPHLKEENFDILIINAKVDQQKALKFKECIQNYIVEVNQVKYHPRVKLLDEIFDISSMDSLDLAFGKTTYVFLFVTKQFCEDTWGLLQSYTCLKTAVQNKMWPVFSVITVTDYTLPMVLGTLQAINYDIQDNSNNNATYEDIRKLVQSNIGMRIRRDGALRRERLRAYEHNKEGWKKDMGISNLSIKSDSDLTRTSGESKNGPVNQQPRPDVTPNPASTGPSPAMAVVKPLNQGKVCVESSAVAENTHDDGEQTHVKQPY